jgi:hypothetical protein
MHTKRRVYKILHDRCMRTRHSTPVRIMQCKPSQDWNHVWDDIHQPFLSDEKRSTWNRAMHDISPTTVRLHKIHLQDSGVSIKCGNTDTLQHRLKSCGLIYCNMGLDEKYYCHDDAYWPSVCSCNMAAVSQSHSMAQAKT